MPHPTLTAHVTALATAWRQLHEAARAEGVVITEMGADCTAGDHDLTLVWTVAAGTLRATDTADRVDVKRYSLGRDRAAEAVYGCAECLGEGEVFVGLGPDEHTEECETCSRREADSRDYSDVARGAW